MVNSAYKDNILQFLSKENRDKCNKPLLALDLRDTVPNINLYHYINWKVSKMWWLKVKTVKIHCLKS